MRTKRATGNKGKEKHPKRRKEKLTARGDLTGETADRSRPQKRLWTDRKRRGENGRPEGDRK
ncbi:Hypothetical predicted protein [Pelobates cultripes]|uniref:Uncharacterized protein n=1 Tax=Pelobates cultripes TaxID=61616 RepID=A0AAD1R2W7_PELCU|nr:Hypothetical predicted protein [Pelobates cultripes]